MENGEWEIMPQLNIGKNYLKRKVYKKILGILIKALISLFTSSFGLIIIIIIGVVLFTIGINNNKGNISDLEGQVPSEYIEYYNEASNRFNVPNWILAAVSKQESNFNPNASYGGAYGIMQMQKIDVTGLNLWNNHISGGLGAEYKALGYNFSSADEMWNIFLKEPKVQIIAGAYMLRYYTNYVLYKKGYVSILDYNNNENMKLIDWNSSESNNEFRDILRRIFACYNGGPGYGMEVNLDTAQHNYPNKVFEYAMDFRDTGIIGILDENTSLMTNDTIEKAINAGMKWLGKSPYVWGGGRTESDVKAGRFDCSSFVHYMYSMAGLNLGDRSSVVTFSLIEMGDVVDPKNMKRGDLLFFDTYTINGHVGVYLGDNKFLHDADETGVSIGDLSSWYWKNAFKGRVRRVAK